MLPAVNIRTTAVAAATALALAMTSAAPANAWGRNEQNFLKGAAATAVIGGLILNAQNQNPYYWPQSHDRQDEQYMRPYYDGPQYYGPRRGYRAPVVYEQTYQPSIYATPAARAFSSYSPSARRQIQAQLSQLGYYVGGIDGAFGPQTYQAITGYAADTRSDRMLSTVGGAYDFYSRLLG